MSRLEERYRFALRLLPAAYRRLWEEEMVSAFLDSMHTDSVHTDSVDTDERERAEYLADYGRPGWSELGSVAALAVRLRIGSPAAPPRYLAWGAALRLVGLMGLLGHAVLATIGLANHVWLTGAVSWLPAPPAEWSTGTQASVWYAVLGVAGFAWVPAYFALLSGRWRAARWLAVVAVVATGAPRVLFWSEPFIVPFWAELLLDTLLVLALAAYHRDCPPVRRRPWLLALAGGTAFVVGMLLVAELVPRIRLLTLLDWPGMCAIAVLAVAMVHLASPTRRRIAVWSHALALLVAAVLALRGLTLVDYGLSSSVVERADLLVGGAEVAALLGVGTALAVRTARALRRLPPLPTGSAAWSGSTAARAPAER